MSTGRKQGLATAYRPSSYLDASSAEAVKCMCGEYMVFTIDALGRVRERCPRCRGAAPPVALRPGEQRGLQTVHSALPAPKRREGLLPPVEPGQLRCQACAEGVERPSHRFCPRCRLQRTAKKPGRPTSPEAKAKMSAAWSPEARLKASERMRQRFADGLVGPRTYRIKHCACGKAFQSTGSAQRWCSKDCPEYGRPR